MASLSAIGWYLKRQSNPNTAARGNMAAYGMSIYMSKQYSFASNGKKPIYTATWIAYQLPVFLPLPFQLSELDLTYIVPGPQIVRSRQIVSRCALRICTIYFPVIKYLN